MRVATLNTSLTRDSAGQLASDLSAPGDPQGTAIAETVQRVAPDVLVLTGFDVDEEEETVSLFARNYLAVGQNDQPGIDYPYVYSGPVNTGIESGADLDGDGVIGGPDDALGYGNFPGQGGMVVFSTEPIDTENIRTFQDMRWSDMPDSELPQQTFSDLEQSILPLTSVGRWDVPITVDDRTVHVLASATADPERTDVSRARNQDEIRFWSDYASTGAGSETESQGQNGHSAQYITDDEGTTGGLDSSEHFVVAGSLKADPDQCGDADPAGISSLLDTDRVADPETSPSQVLDDDTAARTDYVLPSAALEITDSGVFWPRPGTDAAGLVSDSGSGLISSMTQRPAPTDHRLVWTDVVPAP